jgi:hypothetical protein
MWRIDPLDGGGQPGWQVGYLVTGLEHPAGHLAGIAAVVVQARVGGLVRPDHILHREPDVDQVPVGGDVHVLQVVQQRRAVVPGHARRPLDHVVAMQRGHRDEGQVADFQLHREGRELLGYAFKHRGVVVDEVHLVDGQHQVRDPQHGGEERVPPALLGQAIAGVNEDDREVGSGGPGDHVPRVLNVTRRVGDDELTARGGEVAVRHVDGDALLPLGPQAVGQQGQVGVVLAALLARALHSGELIAEDRLGVEQQPPDQGALAVVYRAGGGQPQHVHVPVSLRRA